MTIYQCRCKYRLSVVVCRSSSGKRYQSSQQVQKLYEDVGRFRRKHGEWVKVNGIRDKGRKSQPVKESVYYTENETDRHYSQSAQLKQNDSLESSPTRLAIQLDLFQLH